MFLPKNEKNYRILSSIYQFIYMDWLFISYIDLIHDLVVAYLKCIITLGGCSEKEWKKWFFFVFIS